MIELLPLLWMLDGKLITGWWSLAINNGAIHFRITLQTLSSMQSMSLPAAAERADVKKFFENELTQVNGAVHRPYMLLQCCRHTCSAVSLHARERVATAGFVLSPASGAAPRSQRHWSAGQHKCTAGGLRSS